MLTHLLLHAHNNAVLLSTVPTTHFLLQQILQPINFLLQFIDPLPINIDSFIPLFQLALQPFLVDIFIIDGALKLNDGGLPLDQSRLDAVIMLEGGL